MPISHPQRIAAPWTAEVVDALNSYQRNGVMHPFTCGVDSSHGGGYLLATESGWVCTDCGYRQIWAHGFMADRQVCADAREVVRRLTAAGALVSAELCGVDAADAADVELHRLDD